jgi:AcrR family transcriptional regulator
VASSVDAGTGGKPVKLPSGRHGLPRAFVIHNQRERMLVAVAEVVSRKGYAAMTVRDVIGEAGVSRRTFYEHFHNKEDAFLAAYDHVVDHVLGEVSAAYLRGESWAEGVGLGIQAFVDYLAKDPAVAHVCIVEVLAAGPRALARRSSAMERFRGFIAPGLEQMPATLRAPQSAPDTVIGGIYEMVYGHVLRGETRRLPELAPDLLHTAIVPFVGREEAARASREAALRRGGAPDAAVGL